MSQVLNKNTAVPELGSSIAVETHTGARTALAIACELKEIRDSSADYMALCYFHFKKLMTATLFE
jgi:hypothetical protein